ncbi:hypothetical protein GCM10008066_26800 [Oxalicibacterium faecigallinarum]|uniref:Methyltransferase domain-containing protein n=1 Tax=Oxalicibacterium faecigallinarum TaxID=573741 RepID=A0A8J3AT48_9BURK|nr:hypothetical protein GCM10008066_26800 [Oxalicibacterium faecigallinarum]
MFEHGTGIPSAIVQHGASKFDWEEFKRLAYEEGQSSWEHLNFTIPESARVYLRTCIPQNTLLLGVEMPAWFKAWSIESNIDYIDLRISPVRFARDFYIAIDTNNPEIYERIQKHAVPEEEIRLEATAMTASTLAQQWALDRQDRYPLDLDDTLIYVGQTSFDAAIIGAPGKHLRCQDFANDLLKLASKPWRKILYKPHPFDDGFSSEERKALEAIMQRPLSICLNNSYQIISSSACTELVSISSGVLQEAEFFGKTTHWLHQPLVPLAWPQDAYQNGRYLQVHFQTILAPSFWHQILAPDQTAPRVPQLPTLTPSYGRELLDTWWDYSKFKLWQRNFWIEAFERSGGGFLRHRVETLEQGLLRNRSTILDCDEGNHTTWPSSAQVQGKITIRGKGNHITIAEGVNFDGLVDVTGHNNQIHIDQDVRLVGKIYIWGSGSTLQIGRNSTFARVDIKCHEGKNITIGTDCMFSYDIEMRTTDGHSLVDIANRQRINPPEDIVIGDHVWVGKGVTILKGTIVASNNMIGASALLNRPYKEEQTVLAGSPAKVIKQAITWQREAKEKFTTAELDAWKLLQTSPPDSSKKPASNCISPSSLVISDEDWFACIATIRSKIEANPQQFGRGDLYQAHETWGIKGQRPTLQRLYEYGLEKWLPAHANVLDIGCNIGMFGLALSEKIKSYYGFDHNQLLIDIARQMANVRGIDNCQFECESFRDFTLRNKENKFNVVFSFAVHVWIGMSIADYAKAVYALLKPGGILIWESNRLDTNDKDFFQNVRHFLNAGFVIQSCGKLKDDNIIERGFYVLAKQEPSQ